MKLDFQAFRNDIKAFFGNSVDVQTLSGGFNSHSRAVIKDISENTLNNSINITTDNNFINIKVTEIEKPNPKTLYGFKHPVYNIYGEGVCLSIQC